MWLNAPLELKLKPDIDHRSSSTEEVRVYDPNFYHVGRQVSIVILWWRNLLYECFRVVSSVENMRLSELQNRIHILCQMSQNTRSSDWFFFCGKKSALAVRRTQVSLACRTTHVNLPELLACLFEHCEQIRNSCCFESNGCYGMTKFW